MHTLFFTPYLSPPCDFDLIRLVKDGCLEWEHFEYYPEYIHTMMWEAGYPVNVDDTFNSPPEWFTGTMPKDHPIYGEEVNSLCWEEIYGCIPWFMDTGYKHLPRRIDSGQIDANGKVIKRFELLCFVNPTNRLYAPKLSFPAAVKVDAPKGYKHWLTLGTRETAPEFFVYYPLKPKGQIAVLLKHINNRSTYVLWNHGARGLFNKIQEEIEKEFINYELRTRQFFEEWVEIVSRR